MRWSPFFHTLSILLGIGGLALFIMAWSGVSLSMLGAFGSNIGGSATGVMYLALWCALLTLIHQVSEEREE